ncbi:uncharacterized, partial [Tachysurus ichikawai]
SRNESDTLAPARPGETLAHVTALFHSEELNVGINLFVWLDLVIISDLLCESSFSALTPSITLSDCPLPPADMFHTNFFILR